MKSPCNREDIRQAVESANSIRHTIYLMVNEMPANYLDDDVWLAPNTSERDYSISIESDSVKCLIRVPGDDTFKEFLVPMADIMKYSPVHDDLIHWPQETKYLLPLLRQAGLEPRIHYSYPTGHVWALWSIEDECWADV